MNKKIIVLALAAFTAAFGTYKAFKDLAEAIEDWEMEWDDEERDHLQSL
ncbi:MAG: hypothetical protein RLZZ328_1513 [Bacteroidota bacterium]|jgi:hypothetical protein